MQTLTKEAFFFGGGFFLVEKKPTAGLQLELGLWPALLRLLKEFMRPDQGSIQKFLFNNNRNAFQSVVPAPRKIQLEFSLQAIPFKENPG